MKGIYKHGSKYRVRLYGYHVGVFESYDEAVCSVIKFREEMEKERNFEKYLYHKKWLQDRGLL